MTLPSCVSASVRHSTSSQRWTSEKAARKDAAWQACSALYTAGLLNEHLLPLCQEWGPIADFVELEPGQVQVSKQIDVWSTVGHSLPEVRPRYQSCIRMVDESGNEDSVCFTLITSAPIPKVPSIRVRWSEDQTYCINVAASVASAPPDPPKLALLLETTLTLYACSRSGRRSTADLDLTVFLQPGEADHVLVWLERNRGEIPAEEYYKQAATTNQKIVRVPLPNRPPFTFHGWRFDDHDQLRLACEPLRRRRNLMPPRRGDCNDRKQVDGDDGKLLTFPAARCGMDRMDFRYFQFSLFMPRMFCHISDFMTAHALRVSVLEGIPFCDLQHTITAICAPSSNRETNYQRYEFVGDTVLKFVITQFLFASQPHWPEGFLTKRRVHLVCNERLASEALKMGLDRFIITERIQSRTWTPPTRSPQASDGRTLSTKVLADVVEALIGATFWDTDGDFEAARKCICRLVPAVPSTDPPIPTRPPIPANAAASLIEAERFIGRTFNQKTLLLEALTLSSGGSQLHIESYQRLEFLGDAVLDLIVVTCLLRHQATNTLTQGKLTRLRAALVNGQLLGYFNLHFRLSVQSPTVYTNPDTGDFSITTMESHVSLWHFLRHDSADLATAQQECVRRYQDLSASLRDALEYGSSYPWETLLALHPAKFHSDMIESIIGAILVDSEGQLQPCEDFLTRIGLIGYLERLVRENVDVVHPRDRLQQLLGSREVSYDVRNEGFKHFRGELMVDGVVRARVDECSSRAFLIAKLARMGTEWLLTEHAPDSGAPLVYML